MDVPHIAFVLLLVIGSQVVVWSLIFYRMGRQKEAIRAESWRSGEKVILGPVRANYQGWNGRFGVSKSIGTLALLDHRILFKRPLGPDISIDLDWVAEVSDTVPLGTRTITSANYVSMRLANESSVVFLVPNGRQWIEAIRERLVAN
ncbi:MAG TPA: hypothetical protein VGM51_19075 [Armatimonadota bacterium]|jgi:hypothetical protein